MFSFRLSSRPRNKIVIPSINQVHTNKILPYVNYGQHITFSLNSGRKQSYIQLKVTGNKHCKSCGGK